MNPAEQPSQPPTPEPQPALTEPETYPHEPVDLVAPQVQQTAPTSKKHTTLKVMLWIVATLLCLLVVGILMIVAAVTNLSTSHSNQLNQLQKETTSLFSGANFSTSPYDCHDVELRNQCYFTIEASPGVVSGYLTQNGFSKAEKYGPGYQKGKLYVENTGTEQHYTSYYVAD